MATTSGVYPCYENQFTVKVNGEYVVIADMETFSVTFDNGVQEWTPFESEGWVRRLLTAKGITISVSGKRNLGDAGNNHIAGLAWKNGRQSEADVQWNFPDGTVVEFTGAVINVTNVGAGDSTNVAPLDFEMLSNGKPDVTFPEGAE